MDRGACENYSPLGCKSRTKLKLTEHAHKHLNCSKISFRFNRFVSLTSRGFSSPFLVTHMTYFLVIFLKLWIFFIFKYFTEITDNSKLFPFMRKVRNLFCICFVPIKIVVLEWVTSNYFAKFRCIKYTEEKFLINKMDLTKWKSLTNVIIYLWHLHSTFFLMEESFVHYSVAWLAWGCLLCILFVLLWHSDFIPSIAVSLVNTNWTINLPWLNSLTSILNCNLATFNFKFSIFLFFN